MDTIIAMYVGYQVVDKAQMGFNVRKNVFIISDKSEELSSQILTDLHREGYFIGGHWSIHKASVIAGI